MRELREELAVEARYARLVARYSHAYPDRLVCLYVWQVLRWRGDVTACENQPLRWVSVTELDEVGLLPADRPIVERLQALAGCGSASAANVVAAVTA